MSKQKNVIKFETHAVSLRVKGYVRIFIMKLVRGHIRDDCVLSITVDHLRKRD